MFKLSDDEYVARISKAERHRTKSIIFLIVLALFISIPSAYYASQLYFEATELSNNLQSSNPEVQYQAIEEYDKSEQYNLGILVGLVISMAFFVSMSLFGQVIVLYFNKRKDRLLIKHYQNKNT